MTSLVRDCRVGLRRLARQPGFSATVLLSLGLAIGAAAAAFSVVDAVRLRSLPIRDADRFVLISEVPVDEARAGNACRFACNVSYVTFDTLLASRKFSALSEIAAYTAGAKALTIGETTLTLTGTVASPALFDMFGVAPAIGRGLSASDNRLGAPPVTVLGHGLWASQFGQDPSVLGRVVPLSDTRYTVVGVMPPGFEFESGAAFWLPAVPTLDPSTRPSITTVTVVGRLAPGATLAGLRGELSALDLAAAGRTGAAGLPVRLAAEPFRARYVAAAQGHDLMFLAIVVCVLVIACANVSNVMLARALDDRRSFSIRASLGARGAELIGPMLVEHLTLVAGGALLGLAVASIALSVVRSVDAFRFVQLSGMDYRLDLRAAAAVAGLSAIIALTTSAVPAAFVLLGDVQPLLGEHGTAGRRGARVQRAFVVAQVACAVALVVAGGLVTRTFVRTARTDLGFEPAHVVQATPSYPHDWRVKDRYMPATRRIVGDLSQLPGVASVAVRAFVPLDRQAQLTPAGSGGPLTAAQVPRTIVSVDPGYFATLQIRLLRGRVFTADDRETAVPVAVVNAWAAARWWPGRDPVGETLRLEPRGAAASTLTIVGVVADTKASQANLLLADDGPVLYRPFEQVPSAFPSFFLRAPADAASVLRVARQRFVRLVPDRPLGIQLVADQVARQTGGLRTNAAELVAIASAGLFLALVGLYGVLSYSVGRRTRELGLRSALGATSGSIVGLVLRDALALGALGVVIGLGLAWMAVRQFQPALYGTAPGDPLVYAASAAIAIGAVAVSAWVPARRASRVSPLSALRT